MVFLSLLWNFRFRKELRNSKIVVVDFIFSIQNRQKFLVKFSFFNLG